MTNKVQKALDKYRQASPMVKASFWYLFCSFMQKGISAISTPIFSRLLSTAEYGQYDVFNSWLSILSEIVSLQLFSGVFMQGLVKFDKRREEFASSIQGLSFTLVMFWTIVYLAFHDFWNGVFHLSTVQMLAMLSMIWTTSVFSLWAGEQRVLYKYKNLVIVTIIASVCKPGVGVIFVILSEDKVTARILGLAIVELLIYTCLYFVQMKRGKVFFSAYFWKYALAFNIPLLPHYLSQHILNSADRIMIKHYIGDSEAGIYGLAYSVAQIMKFFNVALTATITPYIYQKIKAKKVEDISMLIYIGLPFVAIVNMMLIVFAPEIVAIFAPADYYNAIWIIPPVALSVYFTFAYDFFAKFSLYFEKTKFVMLASMSGAVLNILLNAIFIPKFGYYAAGYTTLFCYIVYTFAHYLGMRKVCKMYLEGKNPYNMKVIVLFSVVFMVVAFCVMFTYNYPFIRYSIAGLALILMFIFRKKLYFQIKEILNLRKKSGRTT